LTTESRDKSGETRLEELNKIQQKLDNFVKVNDYIIIAGDFNIDNLRDHENILHKSIWSKFDKNTSNKIFKLKESNIELVDA